MSDYQKQQWEDLDVTKDELDRISLALKDNEFKKLFFDYCEEIQDPENRKIYEQELTQLEAERGVNITFLHPEPGFVIKTSVDGRTKGFINIAKSDKIAKPSSQVKFNEETGKKGLNWSLPYAQAPSRHDYDHQKQKCLVYDVLFHPDALRLAETNQNMKKHVVSVACDAIEREFHVNLDRTNLRFPKMKFKGTPKAIVVRKVADIQPSDDDENEPNPINKFMPPIPKANEEVKIYTSVDKKTEIYATPKYQIKHRRGVDLAEMTDELDAKLNLTIPKELIVEIELPMLKNSADCTLDVTEKLIYLISEKPAKYKIQIQLPYEVNSQNGTAKFDISTRKLMITLPVCAERERNLKDLYREDSGVECDLREENATNNSPTNSPSESPTKTPLIDVLDSKLTSEIDGTVIASEISKNIVEESFLKDSIEYIFPAHFDCNQLDDKLVFVLHVKNVNPESLENLKTENSIHLKFFSMGSGYFPVHYSFYCQIAGAISTVETEAWDNNVILTLNLCNRIDFNKYSAGLNEANTQNYEIIDGFEKYHKINENTENSGVDNQEKVKVIVKKCPEMNEIEININPNPAKSIEDEAAAGKDDRNLTNITKKHKKKHNKKQRSYSESFCDAIKSYNAAAGDAATSANNSNLNKSKENGGGKDTMTNSVVGRKVRSFSESRSLNECTPSFKGILKHYSRYGRSMSDSCSSMDENLSCSADMIRPADLFSDIPEEDGTSQNGGSLSESCKKTVRFNSVIQKQLFRLDSSILGQRKKNQKKKQKQRAALQRRNSEGDSADYDDKSSFSEASPDDKHLNNHQNPSLNHFKSNNLNVRRKRADSESSDIDGKNNNFMFHMDL